jgi:peptidylprolyl isomerase
MFSSLISCTDQKGAKEANDNNEKTTTTTSGLTYMILKKGTGAFAKEGQEVLIHETMSYLNDSLLFSSRNLPSPVKVLIGANQAIKGVDEGLRGMQKGEVRKLIVPPSLSKRTGNPTFPHPDSTLVYEIELMEILAN